MKTALHLIMIAAVVLLWPACVTHYAPEDLNDGWQVSTPEEQGVDPEKIEDAYQGADRLNTIYSLLVVKNGFLIAEGYFNGQSVSNANSIASVTKSFTSALTGIALRENVLSHPDQKLMEFFPEIDWPSIDPRKSTITLRQMLQMRSGYPWEEFDGYLETLFATNNWIPFLHEFPLQADPGTRFGYSCLGAHMMAIVVARAAGTTLLEFAQEFLFDPLGITVAYWPTDELGYYHGSGDMRFRPRDLARFGQLYLDRGLYLGRQIVPAQWVADSFQDYSTTTYGSDIMSAIRQLRYGYFWWSGTSGSHRLHFAWGHGGQIIAVADDLNMVVVATAASQSIFDNTSWDKEKAVLELVGRLIASL